MPPIANQSVPKKRLLDLLSGSALKLSPRSCPPLPVDLGYGPAYQSVIFSTQLLFQTLMHPPTKRDADLWASPFLPTSWPTAPTNTSKQ